MRSQRFQPFGGFHSTRAGGFISTWVCLKMSCTPLYPMVLLIIIPFLNGYFIGNINPTFSDKPTYWCLIGNGWEWMGMDGNGWEWMGMDGNGWEWMGMDGNGMVINSYGLDHSLIVIISWMVYFYWDFGLLG